MGIVLAGRRRGGRTGLGSLVPEQDRHEPVLRRGLGPLPHGLGLLLPGHPDRHLDEIPDHGLDVPSDVAHLGELGGLDLHERGLEERRQSPGDLRLADPGRSQHHDVPRHDLPGQ